MQPGGWLGNQFSLSENQWRWWDAQVSCQARGCPACVPLPSERGRLPQRPRQNPLPLPPRTLGRRPEGAPAFQGWGIQRPGGWKLKSIRQHTPDITLSLAISPDQVQWSRAPNLTLGPGPSTQALNCAQSKWQVGSIVEWNPQMYPQPTMVAQSGQLKRSQPFSCLFGHSKAGGQDVSGRGGSRPININLSSPQTSPRQIFSPLKSSFPEKAAPHLQKISISWWLFWSFVFHHFKETKKEKLKIHKIIKVLDWPPQDCPLGSNLEEKTFAEEVYL